MTANRDLFRLLCLLLPAACAVDPGDGDAEAQLGSQQQAVEPQNHYPGYFMVNAPDKAAAMRWLNDRHTTYCASTASDARALPTRYFKVDEELIRYNMPDEGILLGGSNKEFMDRVFGAGDVNFDMKDDWIGAKKDDTRVLWAPLGDGCDYNNGIDKPRELRDKDHKLLQLGDVTPDGKASSVAFVSARPSGATMQLYFVANDWSITTVEVTDTFNANQLTHARIGLITRYAASGAPRGRIPADHGGIADLRSSTGTGIRMVTFSRPSDAQTSKGDGHIYVAKLERGQAVWSKIPLQQLGSTVDTIYSIAIEHAPVNLTAQTFGGYPRDIFVNAIFASGRTGDIVHTPMLGKFHLAADEKAMVCTSYVHEDPVFYRKDLPAWQNPTWTDKDQIRIHIGHSFDFEVERKVTTPSRVNPNRLYLTIRRPGWTNMLLFRGNAPAFEKESKKYKYIYIGVRDAQNGNLPKPEILPYQYLFPGDRKGSTVIAEPLLAQDVQVKHPSPVVARPVLLAIPPPSWPFHDSWGDVRFSRTTENGRTQTSTVTVSTDNGVGWSRSATITLPRKWAIAPNVGGGYDEDEVTSEVKSWTYDYTKSMSVSSTWWPEALEPIVYGSYRCADDYYFIEYRRALKPERKLELARRVLAVEVPRKKIGSNEAAVALTYRKLKDYNQDMEILGVPYFAIDFKRPLVAPWAYPRLDPAATAPTYVDLNGRKLAGQVIAPNDVPGGEPKESTVSLTETNANNEMITNGRRTTMTWRVNFGLDVAEAVKIDGSHFWSETKGADTGKGSTVLVTVVDAYTTTPSLWPGHSGGNKELLFNAYANMRHFPKSADDWSVAAPLFDPVSTRQMALGMMGIPRALLTDDHYAACAAAGKTCIGKDWSLAVTIDPNTKVADAESAVPLASLEAWKGKASLYNYRPYLYTMTQEKEGEALLGTTTVVDGKFVDKVTIKGTISFLVMDHAVWWNTASAEWAGWTFDEQPDGGAPKLVDVVGFPARDKNAAGALTGAPPAVGGPGWDKGNRFCSPMLHQVWRARWRPGANAAGGDQYVWEVDEDCDDQGTICLDPKLDGNARCMLNPLKPFQVSVALPEVEETVEQPATIEITGCVGAAYAQLGQDGGPDDLIACSSCVEGSDGGATCYQEPQPGLTPPPAPEPGCFLAAWAACDDGSSCCGDWSDACASYDQACAVTPSPAPIPIDPEPLPDYVGDEPAPPGDVPSWLDVLLEMLPVTYPAPDLSVPPDPTLEPLPEPAEPSPPPICGDGLLAVEEACDPGIHGAVCSPWCTWEGLIWSTDEAGSPPPPPPAEELPPAEEPPPPVDETAVVEEAPPLMPMP